MSTEEPEPAAPPDQTTASEQSTQDNSRDEGFAAPKMSGQQSAEAAQAYWVGHRNLTIDGPAAVFDHARVQDMQIGDRFNVYIGRSVALTSGSVHEDDLEWVRDRYVKVEAYGQMLETLRHLNILLLHGLPGTGRATTALHLLDKVAKGAVFRLDISDTKVEDLAGMDLQEGHGYFAELSEPAAKALTETFLDKLRDTFESHKCYCVLIAVKDDRHWCMLGGYAVAHEPPSPQALLDRHIECELGPEGSGKINVLTGDKRFRSAWGPAPRPAETVQMALLAVQYLRNEIPIERIEEQGARSVALQITEWFDSLRRLQKVDEVQDVIGLAAFRIALGVFNCSAYHIVAEMAKLLAERLMKAFSSNRPQPRDTSLFGDDQESRLAGTRAALVAGRVAFGHGRAWVKASLVEFQDRRFAVGILRHVWQRHHNMRAIMIEWLRELSKDARPSIWVRAAQAAGFLVSLDFPYTFDKLITPGSRAMDEGHEAQRMFSALAMDQAAQYEETRAIVVERLRFWRRRGILPERWTAAAALGYELGRKSIDRAIQELRILGTLVELREGIDERALADVRQVASRSLAKLFAFGQVGPIIEELSTWQDHDRRSMRDLAISTVVELAKLHSYELQFIEMSGGTQQLSGRRDRERWPLMLVLQDEDPRLTEPFAGLIRWVLRGRSGRQLEGQLTRWFRVAERDAECLAVLARFLPYLVESDHDSSRLRHLVAVMRQDWADPLRGDVADLIDEMCWRVRIP